MARHKKRFGAVTGRKPAAGGRQRTFNVVVRVFRGHGKSIYFADACPKRSGASMYHKQFGSRRCGSAAGSTATAAAARALEKMARKLK